jgi:large subunit ribosomal protein L17
MLSNMAMSLLEHKRISTTLAKAKELRKYIEPLITKAKEDTTHNRRVAFSYLKNKEAIKLLFGEVIEKVGNRPGGYTRIIKTGFRLGDNAEMCIIELVDYNELLLKDDKPARKSSRRSRRGSGKSAAANTAAPEIAAEETKTSADSEEKADEDTSAKTDEATEAASEDDIENKDDDKKAE